MITFHRFHLSVFNDNDDADTPSHFFIQMTIEDAARYLRKIALIEAIEKVDPGIDRIIYLDDSGKYYFRLDEDGNPDEDSFSHSNESRELHIGVDRIHWTCYHASSGAELTTQYIERHQLVNLSKGIDPYLVEVPSMPATFSPLQLLQAQAANIEEGIEASFDTIDPNEGADQNESGDEGEEA